MCDDGDRRRNCEPESVAPRQSRDDKSSSETHDFVGHYHPVRYHCFVMKTFLGVILGTITLLSANAIAQVTTGSGTSGKIPVWTGAHAQGNSIITQSGSNIGIGTTAPTSPLTVRSGAASPAIFARDTGSGPAVWGIANSGFGLRGNSASGTGVGGYSTNYVGLLGNSTNNIGVWEFMPQGPERNQACAGKQRQPIKIPRAFPDSLEAASAFLAKARTAMA